MTKTPPMTAPMIPNSAAPRPFTPHSTLPAPFFAVDVAAPAADVAPPAADPAAEVAPPIPVPAPPTAPPMALLAPLEGLPPPDATEEANEARPAPPPAVAEERAALLMVVEAVAEAMVAVTEPLADWPAQRVWLSAEAACWSEVEQLLNRAGRN